MIRSRCWSLSDKPFCISSYVFLFKYLLYLKWNTLKTIKFAKSRHTKHSQHVVRAYPWPQPLTSFLKTFWYQSPYHLFFVNILFCCVRESQLRGWSRLLAEVWIVKTTEAFHVANWDLLMRSSRLEVLAIPSFVLHSVTLPSSCEIMAKYGWTERCYLWIDKHFPIDEQPIILQPRPLLRAVTFHLEITFFGGWSKFWVENIVKAEILSRKHCEATSLRNLLSWYLPSRVFWLKSSVMSTVPLVAALHCKTYCLKCFPPTKSSTPVYFRCVQDLLPEWKIC